MSNPFPIPLAIMLSNGSRLATPPASSGTFVLNNNGSNEPVWAAAGTVAGMQLLTTDPIPAVDDTVWAVREGTSPSMTVAIRARIAGVTVTIASTTH
jgi:hypothetical protein